MKHVYNTLKLILCEAGGCYPSYLYMQEEKHMYMWTLMTDTP